ncbi:MAG TPA: hypothetical protein VHB70_18985 [Parafilimonas sp.]|nr:hypothetical protein [Parafilimonas sp.]
MGRAIHKGRVSIDPPSFVDLPFNRTVTISDAYRIGETADEFENRNRQVTQLHLFDINQAKYSHESKVLKPSLIDLSINKEVNEALSDFTITAQGIIQEKWKTVETIASMLIEVNDESVVLQCLINEENNIFENRVFEKELVSHLNLSKKIPIMIKIYKRPGEIKFKFIDGKGLFSLLSFNQYKATVKGTRLSKKISL